MPPNKLTFRTEMKEDAAVVYCSGWLMAGETDPLRSEVRSLFPQTRSVILDLSGLTRMDSMGLGAIVSLYVSAKAANCNFSMINFGERVRQLLIMTNLLSVFEEFGSHNLKLP